MENNEVMNFTNIDNDPFNGLYGGKIEVFQPGQTVMLVGWKAEHYAKQLAQKILIRDMKEFNDPLTLDPLIATILHTVSQDIETIEAEAPNQKIAEDKPVKVKGSVDDLLAGEVVKKKEEDLPEFEDLDEKEEVK